MPQLTWLGDAQAKLTARRVPYRLLDGPDDLPGIGEMFRASRERRGPAAALIGLPTS